MSRKQTKNFLGYLYGFLVVAFLLLPAAIIIPASLSSAAILEFPPQDLSLQSYQAVLENQDWFDSALMSVHVAAIAAVVATVAGLFVGVAHYLTAPVSTRLRTFLFSPLLIPHVIVATGLFTVLVNLGLLGNPLVLSLASAALALPLVVVLFLTAFDNLDKDLWTAAISLGASPRVALTRIIIPEIAVSALAALVLAAQIAWDEVTLAVFIGPTEVPTLPARMFAYLRQESDPTITAVASILLFVSLLLLALTLIIARLPRAKRAPEVTRADSPTVAQDTPDTAISNNN